MNCFLGELENINWPQFFNHDSAADPLITYDQQFSTKLDEVINIHFPLKVVKFNKQTQEMQMDDSCSPYRNKKEKVKVVFI